MNLESGNQEEYSHFRYASLAAVCLGVLKVKINQTAINLPLSAICGEFDTFIKCKRVQAMRLLSINKCLYMCGKALSAPPHIHTHIFYRRKDRAATGRRQGCVSFGQTACFSDSAVRRCLSRKRIEINQSGAAYEKYGAKGLNDVCIAAISLIFRRSLTLHLPADVLVTQNRKFQIYHGPTLSRWTNWSLFAFYEWPKGFQNMYFFGHTQNVINNAWGGIERTPTLLWANKCAVIWGKVWSSPAKWKGMTVEMEKLDELWLSLKWYLPLISQTVRYFCLINARNWQRYFI